MRKTILLLCLLLISVFSVSAQDTIPMLRGSVNISITRGSFECEFSLTNLPKIKDYFIRLNSGMNIRYIRSLGGTLSLTYSKSLADTLSTGEATAYTIDAYNDLHKFLPASGIKISYTGMYPVIADTTAAEDWKGNIAFNGKTLRTDGSQAAWYPVLYDIAKDRKYDKVNYDIDINCSDCKTLYLNGGLPVQGTHAKFKSEQPQELTMFLGNYEMASLNNTYLLNANMSAQQLASFEETVRSYKDYFTSHLKIPYKGNAVYIQTTPVSKYNSWLFATYPTIVNIGFGEYDLKSFGIQQKPYLAHELGHYYFGKYRSFNSELGDMLSEGFAEFLSLHVTRKLSGDSIFQNIMRSKIRSLRNLEPTPIASVRSHNDYKDRELYVYYFAPLIFTAIEKEIGEENMWEWMRQLLQVPTGFTNYAFIQQTLGSVVKDKQQLTGLYNKYFISKDAVQNAVTTLGLAQNTPTGNTSENPEAVKTYFYFCFSKPMIDAGAPENKTIKHTEIRSVTCKPGELSKTSGPLFAQCKQACENEAGCSSDFNTYDTMESAKAALERWLKPFVEKSNYVIKVLH